MSQILWYDSLPSTLDEADALVLQGASEGTLVVAAHQTAGRGRRGRVWESFPGNVLLTYITYQAGPPSQLSLLSALALGEALRPLCPLGTEIQYKWPNDLLLSGKKVGGILLERRELPLSQVYLIGCGLNLKGSPETGLYPTTSFQGEGIEIGYETCIQAIASSFHFYLSLWKAQGFGPIREGWLAQARGLGAPVSLAEGGGMREGIFQGINDAGALLLKNSSGDQVLITGEIRALETLHVLEACPQIIESCDQG